MPGRFANLVCGFALAAGASVAAATEIRFDREDYFLITSQVFTVQLIIDLDEAVAGDQLPPGGLFSVGASVTFPPGALTTDSADIVLPAVLDNDGLGGPASRVVSNGLAGAAGAVDITGPGTTHSNTVFLAITFTNQVTTGSYALDSRLFFDPPRNNFVSGQGVRLDRTITSLGRAMVHIIPGPPDPRITAIDTFSEPSIVLSFSDPVGVVALYQVESSVDLTDVNAWMMLPGAVISQHLPGLFEARFPSTNGARYYRIITAP